MLLPTVSCKSNCKLSSGALLGFAASSLTYDILDHLTTDDNTQCLILIQEESSGQEENLFDLIPVTLFDANVVTGEQLSLSGRFCPLMIVSLLNIGSATRFIDSHRDSLRLV